MIYNYDDEYLIQDIDNLNEIEADVIQEIDITVKPTDEFLKGKLVVSKVYMNLALNNSDDETMVKKYDLYKKEFEYYQSLSLATTPIEQIFETTSFTIGRG